jgi:TetR/AcrR family transcriptional repressor of nem operon
MNPSAPVDTRRHILEHAKPLLLRKGFTAVGLAELLAAARVPKGSFYHYFGSKEAFGQAVLDAYFADYLLRVDALLGKPGPAADRLITYFQDWLDSQTGDDAQSRCLAVKLGAEVCDLSAAMRETLERGTNAVVGRLAACIAAGADDGSLPRPKDARDLASLLYQTWLGASLLAKISRSRAPLDTAMGGTRRLLALDT